jgi:hypothetical protein
VDPAMAAARQRRPTSAMTPVEGRLTSLYSKLVI